MSYPQVARSTAPLPQRFSKCLLPLAASLLLAHAAVAADTAPTEAQATPVAAPLAVPPRGLRARLRALELLRKQDPLEGMNRTTYKFNVVLDHAITRPIARSYRVLVPIPLRKAVSNFLANLEYPTVILNDALQGKLRNAGSDALRFIVNSTIGIGGLTDPATRVGLTAHDEDFGQTLGHWGMPSGPYLMLPLLGPSSLRDAASRYVNHFTNLEYQPESNNTGYVLLALSVIDTRTELLAADEAIDAAFDPYTLVRNAYLARREFQVRDGVMPEETYDDLDAPIEESPALPTPPAAARQDPPQP